MCTTKSLISAIFPRSRINGLGSETKVLPGTKSASGGSGARALKTPFPKIIWNRLGKALCFAITVGGILTGCSRPDFILQRNETSGIKSKFPVVWRGAQAGEVISVKPKDGKFEIAVTLNDEYRGIIHSDVTAQVFTAQFLDSISVEFFSVVKVHAKATPDLGQPRIELCGGTDSSKPLLQRGATVEEIPAVIPGMDLGAVARQASDAVKGKTNEFIGVAKGWYGGK